MGFCQFPQEIGLTHGKRQRRVKPPDFSWNCLWIDYDLPKFNSASDGKGFVHHPMTILSVYEPAALVRTLHNEGQFARRQRVRLVSCRVSGEGFWHGIAREADSDYSQFCAKSRELANSRVVTNPLMRRKE